MTDIKGMEPVAYITDEMIEYAKRWGSMCRDCADNNGVCPSTGIACGGRGAAVLHTASAINYGVRNGFIKLYTADQVKELAKDRDYWKTEAQGEAAKVQYRDKRITAAEAALAEACKVIDDTVSVLGNMRVPEDSALSAINADLVAFLEANKVNLTTEGE